MIKSFGQKKNWQNQFLRHEWAMTNARFRYIQDEVLKLSGKEFALLLQVDPASISKWRTENREIPSYIASLVEFRASERAGKLDIPLTLTDMVGLSRAAEARGITVEALLLQLIRAIIDTPAAGLKSVAYQPAILDGPQTSDTLKVAEDPTPPPVTTKPKVTAYKTALNKPAKD
jgi:hypothetical protein